MIIRKIDCSVPTHLLGKVEEKAKELGFELENPKESKGMTSFALKGDCEKEEAWDEILDLVESINLGTNVEVFDGEAEDWDLTKDSGEEIFADHDGDVAVLPSSFDWEY